MWAKLAFKLFRQELKRGELNIILLAIALAVMTVMTLSSITDRIGLSINQKSSEFIAADRGLQSNHKLPEEFLTKANDDGLRTATWYGFDSMLFAKDEMQIAYIKATDEGYPLKGQLKLKDSFDGEEYVTEAHPQPGNIWLSDTVFYSLNIEVGDQVEIGEATFVAEKILAEEPDAPFAIFSSSRRVLMNIADVAKTQVIQPGSRVSYRYLYAGTEQQLSDYYAWLKPQLLENQRWYGVKDRQGPVSDSVNRAERFLLLAGLLGIMLAAVAIAVSARRYCERQYDPVAMMKTLGGSRTTIRNIYITHLLLVTLFSVAIGLLLGFILQVVAIDLLSGKMGKALPAASFWPMGLATFTGIICAVMFSLKPLMDLFDIPPMRVLRRNLGDSLKVSKLHVLLATLTVFALMCLFSRSFVIAGIMFVSCALLAAMLFGLSRLLFTSSRKLGLKPSNSWSLAIASLQKRANANALQVISFALAIKLILFLVVLKNDLIADWQSQLPENAPNGFLVNISEYERTDIANFLAENNIQQTDFYAVVRGRVNSINGELVARSVSAEENEKRDEEARSGVGRELNLTWRDTLPNHNTIVKGEWLNLDENELSMEQSMAERLGVDIGDELEFLIGSQRFTAKITSLREVNWSTMQPNFFIILSPKVLSQFPATYISALSTPAESKRALQQLVRNHPSVSIIDVDSMIKQVRSTIDQVATAISFVLVIVVICGALVLVSQVQASLHDRMQEVVILRTLGAKAKLIKNAVLYEFVLLGLFAGIAAALFSDVALLIVQYRMFEQFGNLHPAMWVYGPVVGALFVALLGYGLVAKTLRKNTQGLVRAL
ncbi:ABC transporter permease [Pseudoalteromonas sp.]|uniref:ABC transporter permease n=1 Tax=Pseudoalteromonas sp. TaxID=53249 RepID=UPI00356A9FA7